MSNNMFLEFTGGPVTIKGETKDSDHVDWVDIELSVGEVSTPDLSSTVLAAPAKLLQGQTLLLPS